MQRVYFANAPSWLYSFLDSINKTIIGLINTKKKTNTCFWKFIARVSLQKQLHLSGIDADYSIFCNILYLRGAILSRSEQYLYLCQLDIVIVCHHLPKSRKVLSSWDGRNIAIKWKKGMANWFDKHYSISLWLRPSFLF